MNTLAHTAVTVADQVLAVGRRLQVLERRLCTPTLDLATASVWADLLADPRRRLEQLLASAQGASAPSRATEPDQPIAPFQWPLLTAHDDVVLAPPPRDPPGLDAVQGVALTQPNPHEERHATPQAKGDPATPPPIGVRLRRDQTALLAILNANLQPDRAAPSPGSVASAPSATGALPSVVTGSQPRQPGRAPLASTAPVGAPPSAAAHQPPQRGCAAAPLAAAAGLGRETDSLDPGALRPTKAAQLPFAPSVSSPADRALAVERTGAREQPPTFVGGLPIHQPLAPFNQLTADPPEPWPSAPPQAAPISPDAPLAWPQPSDETQTLSPAQIDQILAALDERLELLLLRMYGVGP